MKIQNMQNRSGGWISGGDQTKGRKLDIFYCYPYFHPSVPSFLLLFLVATEVVLGLNLYLNYALVRNPASHLY